MKYKKGQNAPDGDDAAPVAAADDPVAADDPIGADDDSVAADDPIGVDDDSVAADDDDLVTAAVADPVNAATTGSRPRRIAGADDGEAKRRASSFFN